MLPESTPRKNENGQALVLVLLSMAVVLTLALSVVSRSVTDINISTHEEESQRAFSAAEAGVEKALLAGSGTINGNLENAQFTAKVTSGVQNAQEYVDPTTYSSGDSGTLWFIEHDTSGNFICDATHPCFTGNTLKICWAQEGTIVNSDTTPAIELTVYYTSSPGNLSGTKVVKRAYDPFSGRPAPNGFASPDGGTCSIAGQTFQFQKTVTFNDLGIPPATISTQYGLLFARVRFLYNDTSQPIGYSVNFPGNGNLPSQGISVESTGTYQESNRKIVVVQSHAEPPGIFESAVYSQGSLSQ